LKLIAIKQQPFPSSEHLNCSRAAQRTSQQSVESGKAEP